MGRRRRIALLLLCAVAVSLTVGSGAFTSTTAERSVDVDVVGDDEAYMTLEYGDTVSVDADDANGTVTDEYLTVRNRFSQAVDIEVTASVTRGDGVDVTVDDGMADLGVGQAASFDITGECAGRSGEYTRTVSFDVTATGEGVSAETTRERTVTLEVTCPADETATTTETKSR